MRHRGVVRGRGDLKCLADRVDPPALPVRTDKAHDLGSRGSSSRAKKPAAAFRISLARRSSRLSRSNSAIHRCSAVVMPGRLPPSTSACLTQCEATPSQCPVVGRCHGLLPSKGRSLQQIQGNSRADSRGRFASSPRDSHRARPAHPRCWPLTYSSSPSTIGSLKRDSSDRRSFPRSRDRRATFIQVIHRVGRSHSAENAHALVSNELRVAQVVRAKSDIVGSKAVLESDASFPCAVR